MSTNNGKPPNVTNAKYEAAIARARGQQSQELVPAASELPRELAIPLGAQDLIRGYTAADLAVDMAKNDFEWAPQVLKLEEGMLIDGILEGSGGAVELESIDRATMSVSTKEVGTWIVRHPVTGYRISFLSTVQLDNKLPPYVGGRVKIYVGPMLDSSKGHRYRDFRVGGERRDEPRSFARINPITSPAVIDVPPAAMAWPRASE